MKLKKGRFDQLGAFGVCFQSRNFICIYYDEDTLRSGIKSLLDIERVWQKVLITRVCLCGLAIYLLGHEIGKLVLKDIC